MTSTRDAAPGADRFLFLGFLLLLVWAPLPVASNHLWAWSALEVCVFALAIAWLVLYAAGRVEVTPAFRQARPALILFALVLALVALQLAPLPPALIEMLSPNSVEVYGLTQSSPVLSLDPAATRAAFLKTLAYSLFFVLTLLLVNRPDRLRTLAIVLVFSGVFQAAFGALMMLSGLEYGFFVEKLHGKGSVTGTFVNPNHLAGYLELCLAVGVGLMLADMATSPATDWRESARRLLNTILGDKARVRIALVIMVIGLVLSKSRMGNVAFFTSLLIAGGFYVFAVRRVSKGVIAFFVSVLLIDILIIGNFFGIDKVAEEIQQATVTSSSVASRIDVSRETMEIVRDYPLTGAGAGSFASTFPMYTTERVGGFFYKHAHNDYAQFAAEFGLPGAAMLGVIVLMSLWNAAAAQFKRRRQLMRGLGCGVLMAIVAILIHSAVDFNLQIPANAATFVVILGMAWQTRWLGHHASARHRSKADRPIEDPADIVNLAQERTPAKA